MSVKFAIGQVILLVHVEIDIIMPTLLNMLSKTCSFSLNSETPSYPPSSVSGSNQWCLDSGASYNMTLPRY